MSRNAEKLRKLQKLESRAAEIRKDILDGCYKMASDTASALDNVADALVLQAEVRMFELRCKISKGDL